MELDDEPEVGSHDGKPLFYACDACRARKVRCDEGDPCAPCISTGKQCTRSHVPKPREKRQRLLVSKQYEHKIDRIEAQLEALTTVLHEVRNIQGSKPESSSIATSLPHTPAQDTIGTVQKIDVAFEGESSLTAHSRFVNSFIERTLQQGGSPQHAEALTVLRELTSEPKPARSTPGHQHDTSTPKSPPVVKYNLPPFTTVAALLKAEREKTSDTVGQWFSSLIHPGTLTQHCMDVYFTSSYTDFQMIIVAGSLTWILGERASDVQDETQRAEYRKDEQLCIAALDAALSRLSLHIPHTMDALYALTTGAIHALETANPVFAWTMVSKASEIAQAMGLHRAASANRRDYGVPVSRMPIFWVLYIIDKGLSLRLGRASSIQDYDVDLPRGLYGPYLNNASPLYVRFFESCIRLAQLQGEIYKELYSPEALTLSGDKRNTRIMKLESSLMTLQTEQADMMDGIEKSSHYDERYDMFVRADQVTASCLLTLVYRALPPEAGSTSILNQSCMVAARATLELHQRCMRMIKADDMYILEMYINWSLLHTPFIPFIVLFCNIMETGQRSDLERLKTFLDSLEPARSLSVPMDKAFRLFQTLYELAQQSAGGQPAVTMTTTTGNVPAVYGTHFANNSGMMPEPGRFPQPHLSVLPADLPSTHLWSAEQQQMLSDWQDEALQLFGTNFVGDGSMY